MTPRPVSGVGRGEYRVAPIVAKYTAVVSTEVLSSELEVGPEAEQARDTLQAAPGYAQSWPPRPLNAVIDRQTDTTTLVLVRLKTVFDFGAELPDDRVGEVREQMAARWPELLSPTASATAAKEGPYERIVVTAIVRSDGNPEWGFERAPTSGRPLPLKDQPTDGRPEFDLFVQNLVRSDLEGRLVAVS